MAERPTTDPQSQPARAQARRDAGLKKISRLTGWALAGTLALTGVISEVAAQARPGHTKAQAKTQTKARHATSTPTPSASSSASSSSSGTGTAQSPSDNGSALQAPSQAPAPSSSSGGSVSGGS